MRDILVVNDLHLGVNRQSGTTPASGAALQQYLLESFDTLLSEHLDKDVLIAGDLFDGFTVDTATLLTAYLTLSGWLAASGGKLCCMAGNHDWKPRAEQVSSFHLLAGILKENYGDRVQVIDEGLTLVREGLWAIPHQPNQDLFDMEMEKAAGLSNSLVILHANFCNPFAEKADHSLNVSEVQARKIVAGGNSLFFGHEHQNKVALGGKVVIAGNQFPSSIADCLSINGAQRTGEKFAHVLTRPNGVWGITPIKTFDPSNYTEVEWQNLLIDAVPNTPFIRVTGTATAEQAADVMEVIAKLRKESGAFVIGNAVKVDGINGVDEMTVDSFETVKAFDVLGALLEVLEPSEQAVVKGLLEIDQPTTPQIHPPTPPQIHPLIAQLLKEKV